MQKIAGAKKCGEMNSLRHTFMVDASYDIRREITGIGIVVHQTDKPKRNGVVIEQISEAYGGVPASTAEKFAVLRALEIATFPQDFLPTFRLVLEKGSLWNAPRRGY